MDAHCREGIIASSQASKRQGAKLTRFPFPCRRTSQKNRSGEFSRSPRSSLKIKIKSHHNDEAKGSNHDGKAIIGRQYRYEPQRNAIGRININININTVSGALYLVTS
jgi:hypothetical protein